jgi:hypothetical protein
VELTCLPHFVDSYRARLFLGRIRHSQEHRFVVLGDGFLVRGFRNGGDLLLVQSLENGSILFEFGIPG